MITAEQARALIPKPMSNEEFLEHLSDRIERDAKLGRTMLQGGYKYDSKWVAKIKENQTTIESFGYEVIIDDIGAYIIW